MKIIDLIQIAPVYYRNNEGETVVLKPDPDRDVYHAAVGNDWSNALRGLTFEISQLEIVTLGWTKA